MCASSLNPTSGRQEGVDAVPPMEDTCAESPRFSQMTGRAIARPRSHDTWQREPAPPGFQTRAHGTHASPPHAASQRHGHCRKSVKASFRASPGASLRTGRISIAMVQ